MDVVSQLQDALGLPEAFSIERLIQAEKGLCLVIHLQTQTGLCPGCGTQSKIIHGHYWRVPQDLPLSQWMLHLRIRVNRFRCLNPACLRQTFATDLAPFIKRYKRRTQRVHQLLTHLGFELGGQAAARIAQRCCLSVSRSTLLRLVRGSQLPAPAPVTVLGVDDWAFCRGERYGTLLVDLERRKVVDVLPDAEAATLATWLKTQPQIQVVSRDRAGAYAEGVRQGAPQALEVADRWHLISNLWDALVVTLEQSTTALRQLVTPLPAVMTAPIHRTAETPRRRRKTTPSALEQARAARRQFWEEKFKQVHQLRAEGVSLSAIARELGFLSALSASIVVWSFCLKNSLQSSSPG
jgi:transposase